MLPARFDDLIRRWCRQLCGAFVMHGCVKALINDVSIERPG